MARNWSIPKIHRHSAPVVDPKTGQVMRRAVLASAVLVRQSQLRAIQTADWQKESWEFYDVVPELHQSSQWFANCMSRVRLYVGRINDVDGGPPTPVDDPRLLAPLNDFFGGQAGQSEMLRRLAVHLKIPGDSYLVGADDPEDGERIWAVASSAEIEANGTSTYLLSGGDANARIRLDPENSMIMRLWNPHAYQSWQADSPTRALRGTLRELQGLSVRLSADIESRLAGAGLLIIPESATLPAPAATDNANPLHDDPFIAELIRSMVTPITDRDSAAAVVPMVVRVPDAAVDVVRHITFSTPLDEKLMQLRDAAIRRVAVGVDMPPEKLLGLGDTNHWNAFQITDDGIKVHIEPTATLIVAAFTTQYYQPILRRDRIVPDPESYCIYFSTADLSQPTDRGKEAQALYALNILSAEATRRENGFSDADAPSKSEAAANLAVTLARSNPELATQLWQIIVAGLDATTMADPAIAIAGTPAAVPVADAPPTTPTTPATAGPPVPGPPPGPAPNGGVPPQSAGMERNGWMTAVEMGVIRALEVAGKRLLSTSRTYRGQFADVPAWELHRHIPVEHIDPLLQGAYTTLRAALPDQPCVVRAVDHYVRHLIRDRLPHQRKDLVQELARIGCVPGGADE